VVSEVGSFFVFACSSRDERLEEILVRHIGRSGWMVAGHQAAGRRRFHCLTVPWDGGDRYAA